MLLSEDGPVKTVSTCRHFHWPA